MVINLECYAHIDVRKPIAISIFDEADTPVIAITTLKSGEVALEMHLDLIESWLRQTNIRVASLELADKASSLFTFNDWMVLDISKFNLWHIDVPFAAWHVIPVKVAFIVEIVVPSDRKVRFSILVWRHVDCVNAVFNEALLFCDIQE